MDINSANLIDLCINNSCAFTLIQTITVTPGQREYTIQCVKNKKWLGNLNICLHFKSLPSRANLNSICLVWITEAWNIH